MDRIWTWYQLAGLQEFTSEIPVNRFLAKESELKNVKAEEKKTQVLQPEYTMRDIPKQNPVIIPPLKVNASDLEELKKEEAAFDGCILKKTAKNMVFADGSIKAKIMFIGEAPGEEEDSIGKPFVGAAGKMLDKIMSCIGYDRTNSYITNILPYRPPGNRNPSETEIAAFMPYVLRHIELVNPKLIVCLGRISSSALLNRNISIMSKRGNYEKITLPNGKQVMLFLTYHPSFLLRTPVAKRAAWKDFLEIKKYMDNLL